jgi:beta-lactamase regulating signal transducer with metallopeptidase domain/ankyrin repeat protein
MIASLSSAAVTLSGSSELLLLVKVTLVLLFALAALRVARTARASARHLVVATSFVALVALPILIAAVPAMTIEVPVTAVAVRQSPSAPAQPAPTPAPGAINTIAERTVPGVSMAEALRAAWLAGTVVFLIPVAAALWRLSMIRRTGLPVAWHRAELSRLAAVRGVTQPVELLEHEAAAGPMTFGVSRPVIVLPPDAREWPEAELRCALMHELEHIQRGDWLMQIMARIVAAGYWFHPLVWTAWRRLCLEAERSCDDAVVASEERTEYAEQLVTLAQRMAATPVQPMLGMANRSDLSTRVTAVLDDRLHRGRAGFTLVAGTIAAATVMVLTVAPVRAVARVAPGPAADAGTLEGEQDIRQLRAEAEILASKLATTADAQEQQRLVRELQALQRLLEQGGRPASGSRRVRAIDRALYEAAEEGDFEGVKDMVGAGANPSATIHGDGNPLIGAAKSGHAEIINYLLDQGADPNGIVEGDGSPLIAAAKFGRIEQVQMLVQRGANVNLAVDGDENPLMNAAEQGHLAMVRFLVENGADIHTRIWNPHGRGRNDSDGEWRTALSQATKNGHKEVAAYLQSLGARN